jgi:hypothetical protein
VRFKLCYTAVIFIEVVGYVRSGRTVTRLSRLPGTLLAIVLTKKLAGRRDCISISGITSKERKSENYTPELDFDWIRTSDRRIVTFHSLIYILDSCALPTALYCHGSHSVRRLLLRASSVSQIGNRSEIRIDYGQVEIIRQAYKSQKNESAKT